MKISCLYCGIVDKPHDCPRRNKTIKPTDRTREDNKVYESKRYRKIRRKVLEDYDYLCLWSFYIEGKIVRAKDVHHIVEITDDNTKAYDYDNLIPLEEGVHRPFIHNLYKINKEYIQNLLRDMLKAYQEEDFTLGKFKDRQYPPTIKKYRL